VIGAELARLHDFSLPCPERFHNACEIDAWSRPARQIGGDLLAAYPVEGAGLVLFLGDVMGHGTPAAVVASALRAGLHQLRVSRIASPGVILFRLNQMVCDLFPEYFVTASASLLDETGKLTCAQAGHPPLLVRHRIGEVSRVSFRSLPLGLTPGTEYQEKRLDLPAGAALVLYSDGVIDGLAAGDRPGLDVLMETVGESRRGNARALVRRVRRALRQGCRDQDDDRAVLAMSRGQ
jgi:sigma-B regulation protein RsbU (phosphoserine phosphatase)